jgi:type 1 glutamine amidotransferase
MKSAWFAAVVLGLAMTVLAEDAKPIKVLIITGDHGYHDWKATTPFVKKLLDDAGMKVDVTETPAKDLTAENLVKYDALLLNYRDMKGPPETRWSDANKKAFKEAVAGGKGLYVYHFASSAFVGGDEWSKEYEKIVAGGWRKQGYHGKRHEFEVSMTKEEHPITKDMPKFAHSNDELYQNSLIPEGSTVLATAWSDKKKDPKNTDKNEPVVWVAKYGEGRVCENSMGHDVAAMQDLGFQTLLVRGVEWAATGAVKTPVPEALKKVGETK